MECVLCTTRIMEGEGVRRGEETCKSKYGEQIGGRLDSLQGREGGREERRVGGS